MLNSEWIEIPKIPEDRKLRGSTSGNIYIENTPSVKQDTVKITLSSVRYGKTEKHRCDLAKNITDKVKIINNRLLTSGE